MTSLDNYEEYKVEEQQRHVSWINLPSATFQPLDFILSAGLPTYRLVISHFRLHSIVIILDCANFTFDFSVAINRVPLQDASQNRIYQLFLNESPLTERFARLYSNDAIPPRYTGVTWRAYCYYRRLYAMPFTNTWGNHVRNITAQFFRENPAQIHRLIPWLNRELLCLCSGGSTSINVLLQTIETLIQTHDMTSREFRRRVRSIVPSHTNHFVHELVNFARSPFDMIGYDRNVIYSPIFVDDPVFVVSSSDESDVAIVSNDFEIDNRASTSNQTQNAENSNFLTVVYSSSDSEADEVVPIQPKQSTSTGSGTVTALRTELPKVTNPSPTIEDVDSDEEEITNYLQNKPNVSNEEMINGRSAIVSPIASSSNQADYHERIQVNSDRSVIVTISSQGEQAADGTSLQATTSKSATTIARGDDSDSEDCLFVCAKKPPHLRTPEYVELNSESDSDVIFVDTQEAAPGQVIKTENCQTTLRSASVETKSQTRRARRNQIELTEKKSTSQLKMENCRCLPSTSSNWVPVQIASGFEDSTNILPSSNRTNAIVFNHQRSSVVRSRGKRIYESTASEESDGEHSTDHGVSSEMSDPEDDQMNEIDSSSHEEYEMPVSMRKRKAVERTETSTTETPQKKYRKKTKSKKKSPKEKTKKTKSERKASEKRRRGRERSKKRKTIEESHATSSSYDSGSDN